MNRICIEHIEPGMVLAKNVVGLDGSVVLESGVVLGPEHMETLLELGAAAVYVKPGPGMDPKAINMARIENHVRRFFSYVDPDNPVFEEMFQVSLRRCTEAINAGWDPPCEAEMLARNVEHLADLFLKDAGTPEHIVQHENELASFPDIYFKIKEVLEAPNSSAKDIARVVNTDVGLSVKLLRLVNSPFFGFTTTIDSVVRAVSLVGVKELSTLALGISTINFFKDIPPELMDMAMFWKHSLRCAIFAKLLAVRQGMSSDRFFTAGLLHDVGRLVLFKNMPYASTEAMLYARGSTVPLVEAENEVLGFDHTEVGRLLLEQWQFPPNLIMLIAHHHDPSAATDPREAAVIQLADNLANAAEIAAGGVYVLPGMERAAWESMALQIEDLDEITALHDAHIEDITATFL